MTMELNQATPKIFKALAEPIRREILVLLREKSLSAGEIVAAFDLTGATISYHLSILTKADLIKETKVKNFIYYELNASVFQEIILWMMQFNKLDQGDRHDDK